MKIAITGGAGFVGSHLARAYLDAGHDVLVIDNLMAGSRQLLDPRAYGLQHTILRYADIYGEPSGEFAHHPLSYFITMLSENQRPVIRRCVKEIRDHIFIDDVVRANLL